MADPTKPTIIISAIVSGYPIQVQFAGSIEQLPGYIERLEQRGATPPAGAAGWATLPDGTPLCPKHRVPMRLREKQGDQWWSHNVAGEGEADCYCRGYPGKNSPGWER